MIWRKRGKIKTWHKGFAIWGAIAKVIGDKIKSEVISTATEDVDMPGVLKSAIIKKLTSSGESALDGAIGTEDVAESVVNEDLASGLEPSSMQQDGLLDETISQMVEQDVNAETMPEAIDNITKKDLEQTIADQTEIEEAPEGLFGMMQGMGYGFVDKKPAEADPSVWWRLGNTLGKIGRSRAGAGRGTSLSAYNKQRQQRTNELIKKSRAIPYERLDETVKELEGRGLKGTIKRGDYGFYVDNVKPIDKEKSNEDYRKQMDSLLYGGDQSKDKSPDQKQTTIEPRATGLGRIGRGAAYKGAVERYGEDEVDLVLKKAMDLERSGKSLAEIGKMLKDAGYNPDLFLSDYR